ncbi:MAG: 30S ribosomal protein S1 [Planctomycetota bacterium]
MVSPEPDDDLPPDADDVGPDDDALAREIEEALGGQTVAELAGLSRDAADAMDRAPLPPTQDVREGAKARAVVAGVSGDDVFLEFGLRQQGVVPRAQFAAAPEVGDTIEVHVVEHDPKEDLWICAARPQVRGAGERLSVGDVVKGTVRQVNAGGLELQVGLQSAFLPVSHIELERVEDMEPYLGRVLDVEVIESDPERRRLVVSRRGVLQRERDERRRGAVAGLSVGARLTGPVTRVETFGAFVDLGGVEGLVHVSELAHKRVERAADVVQVGEILEVEIVGIEEDGRRIRLSRRALQQDPYSRFLAAHPVGSQVEGKVTRIATYGAFLEVGEDVEGLAHISQLAPGGVGSVKEVLKIGQTVTVRVASIEPERRRIGLSLLTERGDRLTDDVADDATIRQYAKGGRDGDAEPTLGDLLRRALEGK